MIVTAERLVPGINARHCASPIKKASFADTESCENSDLDFLSAIQRSIPNKMVEIAMTFKFLRFSVINSLIKNPTINIGIEAINNLFKKESIEEKL